MAGFITRVLVIDDHEPWHSFYSTALQEKPDLRVIGHVSDGLEAVRQAEELQPDLILLDIGLPTLNGIEAARRIREVSPASKILFITENRSAEIAKQALRAGAGGYVVKSNAASDLLPAVAAVLKGKRFLSASLTGHDLVTSQTGASESGDRVEDNPYLRLAGNSLISEFLALVIAATAADFGNIQLFDSTNSVLRIVAQHGFHSEFLNYFDTVSVNKECVCGAAMRGRSCIIGTDVATNQVFSDESRGVLLRANVRSVQSTPLIDRLGKFVGMVSTHCTRPGSPVPDVLGYVDILSASFLAKMNV
jgi:DNA-binding NarL/FixJ family response regulator